MIQFIHHSQVDKKNNREIKSSSNKHKSIEKFNFFK